MKVCVKCQETKPTSEYGKGNRDGVDGLRGRCKPCIRSDSRAHYRANIETERVRNRIRNQQPAARYAIRKCTMLRKYGLTPEQVDQMKRDRRWLCDLCGEDRSAHARDKDLHVDHCHSTGKVRGMLCPGCNKALGLFKDDPARLIAAAAYLSK